MKNASRASAVPCNSGAFVFVAGPKFTGRGIVTPSVFKIPMKPGRKKHQGPFVFLGEPSAIKGILVVVRPLRSLPNRLQGRFAELLNNRGHDQTAALFGSRRRRDSFVYRRGIVMSAIEGCLVVSRYMGVWRIETRTVSDASFFLLVFFQQRIQ
jgi:hypothetical protein